LAWDVYHDELEVKLKITLSKQFIQIDLTCGTASAKKHSGN